MIDLYNHPLSPFAKRVRVLTAELGLPTRIIEVDFTKGENREPGFLAKNPNGKVPVISKDGCHLWESAAILYELASENPKSGLVPAALSERAEMLRWMFWSAAHFEPAVGGIAYQTFIKPRFLNQQPDQARIEELSRDFARFAQVLNGHLAGRAWILGENFSIADVALGSIVELAQFLKIPLDPYPEIVRWLGALAARESWAA